MSSTARSPHSTSRRREALIDPDDGRVGPLAADIDADDDPLALGELGLTGASLPGAGRQPVTGPFGPLIGAEAAVRQVGQRCPRRSKLVDTYPRGWICSLDDPWVVHVVVLATGPFQKAQVRPTSIGNGTAALHRGQREGTAAELVRRTLGRAVQIEMATILLRGRLRRALLSASYTSAAAVNLNSSRRPASGQAFSWTRPPPAPAAGDGGGAARPASRTAQFQCAFRPVRIAKLAGEVAGILVQNPGPLCSVGGHN